MADKKVAETQKSKEVFNTDVSKYQGVPYLVYHRQILHRNLVRILCILRICPCHSLHELNTIYQVVILFR